MGLVFYEVLDLLHAQGELIDKGILIRGGVTYGDIYVEKNKIFGPALIDAYDLESKQAIYPRIVISNKLIAELRTNRLLRSMNNNPQEEFRSVCEILKKGEDQKWFIDYLGAIEPELDDPAMYPLLLMKHKELVENGAEKYAKKPSVKAKYTWLSRYHNKLVKDLKKKWLSFYGIKSGDLRIVLNR